MELLDTFLGIFLSLNCWKLTWHMFSFMEAGPPRSPMIFLIGKSESSHSDKSSFMEQKLLSRLDGSPWGDKAGLCCCIATILLIIAVRKKVKLTNLWLCSVLFDVLGFTVVRLRIVDIGWCRLLLSGFWRRLLWSRRCRSAGLNQRCGCTEVRGRRRCGLWCWKWLTLWF